MPAATRKYVALIRGINVGKAKRVAMADLRALLEELGYREVRTLLNSGNVVFSAGSKDPGELGRRIAAAMTQSVGVSAAVMVLTAEDFAAVVKENPLARVATDPTRLLVAFCTDGDRLKQVRPLAQKAWSPEAVAVGRSAAYIWCPDGILTSRALEAVGQVLGAATTTRNWATVTKIHAALGS